MTKIAILEIEAGDTIVLDVSADEAIRKLPANRKAEYVANVQENFAKLVPNAKVVVSTTKLDIAIIRNDVKE